MRQQGGCSVAGGPQVQTAIYDRSVTFLCNINDIFRNASLERLQKKGRAARASGRRVRRTKNGISVWPDLVIDCCL